MELVSQLFALVLQFLDVLIHIDVHLNEWIRICGPNIYLVLFLVIFCETGLIVTPFLPGDSLLFALGALCASRDSALDLPKLMVWLSVAAVAGDAVNYWIGKKTGPKVFRSETSRLFNQKHLLRTQHFYEKYGGKTIVFARFIPIIRTFAPFVAGIGQMRYTRFALFNVTGGVAWILIFLLAGHHFGNLPYVKKNFHIVIFAIIIISAMPVLVEWCRMRRENQVQDPSLQNKSVPR